MEWHLLIAEPHQAQREHLCAIYSASPLVACTDEAASSEELCTKLETIMPDFVVVQQSLITDVSLLSLLPRGHFVVLAAEPAWQILTAACRYSIRGYFLENPLPPEELLTASLTLRERQCLLDPRLTFEALQSTPLAESSTITEMLSPREQQVFALWSKGQTSRIIGEQLAISEGTVKKHLEHIRKKLREQSALALMRGGV